MKTIRGHASLQKGDWVKIDLGPQKLRGVIVEDRGAIGVNGRRLFRVEIGMDPFEPMVMELPENEVEPVGPEPTPVIAKERVIDYFINGGLISILRSNNSGGGKNQPRVWIRPDNLGNVTYTFLSDHGVVGGATVPFATLRGEKIFSPKRDEVVSYVEHFGLNSAEAEKVVSEVGTAP